MATTATRCQSGTSSQQDNSNDTLLKMMASEADVELIFDEAHTGDKDTTVLTHSCILRLNSAVIAIALKAGTNSGDKNTRSGSTCMKVRMPGTLKADFMVLAPFMYPILPRPIVTWDNLEVLLVEGRKWDMPVVLAEAAAFIVRNNSKLDMASGSKKDAFQWLALADAADLQDACQACVSRIVASSPGECSRDRLQGLSVQTLQCFVVDFGRVSKSLSSISCSTVVGHIQDCPDCQRDYC